MVLVHQARKQFRMKVLSMNWAHSLVSKDHGNGRHVLEDLKELKDREK